MYPPNTQRREDYDQETEEVHESFGNEHERFKVIKEMFVRDRVTLVDTFVYQQLVCIPSPAALVRFLIDGHDFRFVALRDLRQVDVRAL